MNLELLYHYPSVTRPLHHKQSDNTCSECYTFWLASWTVVESNCIQYYFRKHSTWRGVNYRKYSLDMKFIGNAFSNHIYDMPREEVSQNRKDENICWECSRARCILFVTNFIWQYIRVILVSMEVFEDVVSYNLVSHTIHNLKDSLNLPEIEPSKTCHSFSYLYTVLEYYGLRPIYWVEGRTWLRTLCRGVLYCIDTSTIMSILFY